MAIIGTFTEENGVFSGIIRTLTFTAHVTIEPVARMRGENSPDYRVYCQSSGPGDIGAAWKRQHKGKERLSVRIDDPTFTEPLDCPLINNRDGEGYSLIWERKR